MDADKVFRALSDGGRRALLDRLRERGGQSQAELCAALPMTRQAVSKHLDVLEAANLVATLRRGRVKLHFLNPVPIAEIAGRWIGRFDGPRLAALAELKQSLEEKP